jgi:Contractile injection system tube protein
VKPLAHATLQRLRYASRPGKNKPVKVRLEGPELAVQFNPASLKISRKNNIDRGGVTTGTQKRQHVSQESSSLSFELEFDTAEQGSSGQHVDVRDWTALVRQFVEPPPDNPGGPPPAVRFAWGTIVFDGIIEQVTEDLDYFAADGTPLRAKVGVTITEQNFLYENKQTGPATKNNKSVTEPGVPSPGSEPGSSGSKDPDQVVTANDGESAQQLMSRLGLDPAAWRAAMTGLDSPLSLPAGTPVQLGPEAATSGTLGATPGFATGPATTSVEGLATALVGATAGLEGVQAAAQAGAPAGLPAGGAGFALAAGGGIVASARAVAAAVVAGAATAARAAFAVPGELAGPAEAGVDVRALTYGRAVPLRARADVGTLTEIEAGGGRSLAARARRTEVPVADAVAPPWVRLPPAAAGLHRGRGRGDRPASVRIRLGGGIG